MSKTTITHTSRLLKPVTDRQLIAELEAARQSPRSRVALLPAEAIQTAPAKPGIGDVTFKELMFGHPKTKHIVAARLILYVLLVVPAFILGKQQDQS